MVAAQVHVYISAQEEARLCESAFCWLLTQAKQVQVIPVPSLFPPHWCSTACSHALSSTIQQLR